jgi:hypothetical protein
LANSRPFERAKKFWELRQLFFERVMNDKKNIFKEACKHPLLQLGWLLDPASPPEHMVQFVLARRKHKRLVWRVCKVEEVSRTCYTYLFVLTVLAHSYLRNSGELPPFKVELGDSTYGPIVRYFYNLMGKPKDYRNIDPFVRQKILEIFKRSTKEGVHLSLVDKYDASIFAFGQVSKSPAIVTDGPHPKEIEYDEIDFEQITIDDELLGDLTDHICSPAFWTDFTRITKGRRRRKRTGPAHEDLWYLRRAEDVLEMYDATMSPGNARWFRKTGPIAVDFAQRTVYIRRRDLTRLKAQVSANHISLLVGPPASGKTVLALNLAYELCKSGKAYYFDCDKARGFDGARLLSDLRAVKGTVIIENIHLVPQESQSIYSAFKHDKDRHILFTSRPSLADGQYSRSEDLTEVEGMRLKPIEAVDELINTYCIWHKIESISPEAKDEIKDVASDNLWLLAYLLDGHRKSGGKGDPSQWLKDGVVRDLQDLESANPVFPQVLVAISALYRIETLTAENYLTSHLGCSLIILNALVQEGEITRQQSSEGYVFYGLPHSALANAYWEFGKKYKRRMNISRYEDFLYEYASSGAPNGLEAIVQMEEDRPRKKATSLLADKGKLTDVISNEQSTQTVADWLYRTDTRIVARDDVIASLVHKVQEHDSADAVGDFLEKMQNHGQKVWQKFYTQLNVKKLVDRMANTAGSTPVALAACDLLNDEEAARKLYDLIDLKDLIAEMNQGGDLRKIERPLLLIYRLDPQADKILSSVGFDWRKFAGKLCSTRDLIDVETCIRTIVLFNQRAAKRLCKLLAFDKLVENLRRNFSVWSVADVISTIYWADRSAGRRLWDCLKQKLVDRISQIEWPPEAEHCIWAISDNASRGMGQELVSLLNLEQLAERLSRPRYLQEGVNCAVVVIQANREVGSRFWKLYSPRLAAVLNESDDRYRLVGPCIGNIAFRMPRRAGELCKLLDMEKLAANLNNAPDLWNAVCECVWKMLKANKTIARKLWCHIDKKKMKGGMFSNGGASYLSNIHSLDPRIAEDLCRLLSIDKLLKALNQTDVMSVGPYGSKVGSYVSVFFKVDHVLGQQLWQGLDKEHLASQLSSSEDIYDTSSFIEKIYDVDYDLAEEFCNLLDCNELVSILDAIGPTETGDRLLELIAKANPFVHQKLLDLLNEQ